MFEDNKLPILGILRGIEEKNVIPLALTCIESGISSLEITMNTRGACELIRQMIAASENNLVIGAGTVLNLQDLEYALKAGAKFIVCPSTVEAVINECSHLRIPVFPGALTPSEVHRAWEMGATMVKLFPASVFGPSYIKELKGPFDLIKIMAVGGVSAQNISQYFNCGADAVAFGASIFKPGWLKEDRYDLIKEDLCAFISSYKKFSDSQQNNSV
jgi:2-dehydro-3-deoxyphosphogluconate aldolase / (4S)-4-hydroxy-2-oxoglutarate aldolase